MKKSETSSLDPKYLEQRIINLADLQADVSRTLLEVIKTQRQIIAGFYDAIQHGDDAHKRWLKELVDSHVNSYNPTLCALSDRLERFWERIARKD